MVQFTASLAEGRGTFKIVLRFRYRAGMSLANRETAKIKGGRSDRQCWHEPARDCTALYKQLYARSC